MTGDGADKIETKLLLQKSLTHWTHTANFILERSIGEHRDAGVEYGFAWSTLYDYSEHFRPGFEMYNEFGAFHEHKDFDEQEHQIGPVIEGNIGSFAYNLGYLWGVSEDAHDGELKAIFEYEWYF